MITLETPYKAWWICRACQLVTVTHLSEDGRKAIVCREGEQEGLTVDADDVFDTNQKALEDLQKHVDYFEHMRDKVRKLIGPETP